MNDLYQRILVAGEPQDCAQIMKSLETIHAGNDDGELKLVNYFREMPVSYPATLLTVEEHSVELQVHPLQAVVIASEKVTVLKSSHFPKDVLGKVTYVNVEKCRVVLSGFSYAVVRADRRMSVRVELADPVYASFTATSAQLCGKLHDMSLTGVSVTLPHPPQIPLSEEGSLSVTLPVGPVTVPASVLKVVQLDDGCRCIFEIEPTRSTEKNISQYIFQRQVEIIRELKDHPRLPI